MIERASDRPKQAVWRPFAREKGLDRPDRAVWGLFADGRSLWRRLLAAETELSQAVLRAAERAPLVAEGRRIIAAEAEGADAIVRTPCMSSSLEGGSPSTNLTEDEVIGVAGGFDERTVVAAIGKDRVSRFVVLSVPERRS